MASPTTMLSLLRFLAVCGVAVNETSYKVHLAYKPRSTKALDEFLAGRFQAYQERQTKKNFECEHVIGLVRLRPSRWVFAGVWKVHGIVGRDDKYHYYSTELLPGQGDIVGRIIVHHARKDRPAYLIGKQDDPRFVVSSLLEEPLTIADFPGFRQVSLTYSQLQTVVAQSIDGWRTPLSSVKGVYVITDQETGKQYVGSATGDDGLWGRWETYVKTGHGGNRELRAALDDKGVDYAENFRFTVLEMADLYATDELIIERESYWKDALGTREHGYNAN